MDSNHLDEDRALAEDAASNAAEEKKSTSSRSVNAAQLHRLFKAVLLNQASLTLTQSYTLDLLRSLILDLHTPRRVDVERNRQHELLSNEAETAAQATKLAIQHVTELLGQQEPLSGLLSEQIALSKREKSRSRRTSESENDRLDSALSTAILLDAHLIDNKLFDEANVSLGGPVGLRKSRRRLTETKPLYIDASFSPVSFTFALPAVVSRPKRQRLNNNNALVEFWRECNISIQRRRKDFLADAKIRISKTRSLEQLFGRVEGRGTVLAEPSSSSVEQRSVNSVGEKPITNSDKSISNADPEIMEQDLSHIRALLALRDTSIKDVVLRESAVFVASFGPELHMRFSPVPSEGYTSQTPWFWTRWARRKPSSDCTASGFDTEAFPPAEILTAGRFNDVSVGTSHPENRTESRANCITCIFNGKQIDPLDLWRPGTRNTKLPATQEPQCAYSSNPPLLAQLPPQEQALTWELTCRSRSIPLQRAPYRPPDDPQETVVADRAVERLPLFLYFRWAIYIWLWTDTWKQALWLLVLAAIHSQGLLDGFLQWFDYQYFRVTQSFSFLRQPRRPLDDFLEEFRRAAETNDALSAHRGVLTANPPPSSTLRSPLGTAQPPSSIVAGSCPNTASEPSSDGNPPQFQLETFLRRHPWMWIAAFRLEWWFRWLYQLLGLLLLTLMPNYQPPVALVTNTPLVPDPTHVSAPGNAVPSRTAASPPLTENSPNLTGVPSMAISEEMPITAVQETPPAASDERTAAVTAISQRESAATSEELQAKLQTKQ